MQVDVDRGWSSLWCGEGAEQRGSIGTVAWQVDHFTLARNMVRDQRDGNAGGAETGGLPHLFGAAVAKPEAQSLQLETPALLFANPLSNAHHCVSASRPTLQLLGQASSPVVSPAV